MALAGPACPACAPGVIRPSTSEPSCLRACSSLSGALLAAGAAPSRANEPNGHQKPVEGVEGASRRRAAPGSQKVEELGVGGRLVRFDVAAVPGSLGACSSLSGALHAAGAAPCRGNEPGSHQKPVRAWKALRAAVLRRAVRRWKNAPSSKSKSKLVKAIAVALVIINAARFNSTQPKCISVLSAI